ncbi:hypothetical protein [Ideonella margarita]|uniref:Flagellar protein FlgN n=1 Tax=Ideonella margarita TaxID=2984191 RepID=A0ABU9C908_9BURK
MLSSSPEQAAVRETAELETCLGQVELHLAALGTALKQQDPAATEQAASDLHRALAAAVDRFSSAARHGGVPPTLRRRLAMTGGQVAAQREAVARATTALDRAIDVLLPDAQAGRPGLYGAQGQAYRPPSQGGVLQA